MSPMDRSSIQRSDFATAENGYEQAEVESHLSVVADALEEQHRREAPASMATVAADRVKEIADAATSTVRDIVAAAERSAEEIRASATADATAIREAAERDGAELRRKAEQNAKRLTLDSERAATELVEGAHARAAAHLETVAAAKSLLERFGVSATSLLAELEAFEPGGPSEGGDGKRSAADSVSWRPRDDATSGSAPDAPPPAQSDAPAAPASPPNGELTIGRFNKQRPKRGADEAAAAGPGGPKAQKMSMTAFEMVIRGTSREQIAERLKNEFELGGEDQELLRRTLDQAHVKGANWSTGKPANGDPPRRRGFLRR